MTALFQLLDRLDQWLRAHRPVYYEHLRPPLTDAQLKELESLVGVALPEDFKALYKWKGGQSGSYPELLYDDRTFMQPKEICEAMRANNELRDMGMFRAANWWQPHWIPFLTDASGNLLCLDTAGSFTGQSGQLIHFRNEDPMRTIEYPDMSSFLENLLAGFKAAAQAGGLLESIAVAYPAGYPIHQRAT